MTIKFGVSCTCSSFDENTVGTKVLNETLFLNALEDAFEEHNASEHADRIPGQHFVDIEMRPFLKTTLSSGVGRLEGKTPSDFVVREHRGECSAYLGRDSAEPFSGCAAVVYDLEAYAADPEVDMAKETFGSDVTHVIVAVLAFAGPASPLTYKRFAHNLGGGNKEALAWSADEIRAEADEVSEYWSEWAVVAD